MFFAKYDVDGDGEFSYEEGQQLVEDLENDMIDQVNIRALLSLKNGSTLHLTSLNCRPWRGLGQGKVKEDLLVLQFRLISTTRSSECKKLIPH